MEEKRLDKDIIKEIIELTNKLSLKTILTDLRKVTFEYQVGQAKLKELETGVILALQKIRIINDIGSERKLTEKEIMNMANDMNWVTSFIENYMKQIIN